MNGWIKLHTKFTEWEWYQDAATKSIFIHLLLNANFKDSKYQGHEVPRGAVVTGYSALAEQTGLSVQNVRTAFKKLQNTGELTVKKTPKFSIVSITKWDEYQVTNSQLTVNQQSTNSQLTPSEEYNTNPKGLDAPCDVRSLLWSDGLRSLQRQTGKTEGGCRSLIGKWLKTANDDCSKVLTTINQSEADRRIDPVAWITKVVEPQKRRDWGGM